MSQRPSSIATQYEVIVDKRPTGEDGYPQRIEIWNVLSECGLANRTQLFYELQRKGHKRPRGAEMDIKYVRIELTDMCKRGFIKRVSN